MSQIHNNPSVRDYQAFARLGDDFRLVGRDGTLRATGKMGAWFSGAQARSEAMSNFIGAITREYGEQVGNLASAVLAAPRMKGQALTGAMVKDVLSVCLREQTRIQEFNHGAAAQSAPEAVNHNLAELTAQYGLDEAEQATVRSFLEHSLEETVKTFKDPAQASITAESLTSALQETARKDLPELLAAMGKGEFSSASDLASVRHKLQGLPPLTYLELGKAVCGGSFSSLAAVWAKEHLADIMRAAGPDGRISRATVWEGLSGRPVPEDMSIDAMSADEFGDALMEHVIGPRLLEGADVPEEGKALHIVQSAIGRGLSLDAARACLRGGHTITLADFVQPLTVNVAHFTQTLTSAENALARDLARRGGWASGNANNRPFNASITFEHGGGSSQSINLSDPGAYLLSEKDADNYRNVRPSSVSLQCCAQALQLCEGNELQASRLVGALGQQNMIWARFVSPILNIATTNRVIGEHSPASCTARRLENGDISVSMHTLDPNRTSYSISYLVKPDGSTPVTDLQIRPYVEPDSESAAREHAQS